ncbi:ABC transporter permease [Candidatus Merdisoma sp. JLR.KK006]|jgi:ribose transport system permease protein|uniref:ABC transporter permease n=1 Tax=Candidatus Merdisoma sp. JLR.KK006 TaxID=3112626 RepID=UPI002FEEB0CC
MSSKIKFKENPVVKYFSKYLGVYAFLVVIIVFMTVVSDKFLTTSNIINVLRQISVNAIIAFGMTYCILLGGIDLSVGAVICLSGVLTAKIISGGGDIYIAMLAGVAVGVISGAFNGILISNTGIAAFVITFCSQSICNGLAYVLTKGSPITCNEDSFTFFGNGYISFIPVPVVIMLIVFLLVLFLLTKTVFGKYVYAIGGNQDCAVYAGINTKKVETLAYVLSGTLAGLAGVILAARMYSGQPNAGDGYELNAIAATVIGGTSMTGGIGSVAGTILGALIIGIMNNGLNLMKAQYYYQTIAKGVVILVAVLFDTYKRKLEAKRQLEAAANAGKES